MNRLSDTLSRGNNNFDLIRLVAALAVMLGHSYGIQAARTEPMFWFSHLESFGSLAVYAFFMISGMLVSASFANQSSTLRFIGLRALRIWPGAIVCAAFIALVVGPMFSGLPLAAYFTDARTFHWLFHNATLFGRVGGPLPGVFEENHLKALVNATVWTLPVELKCYVIVLVAGLLGAIRSRRVMVIVVALVGAVFAIFANHPPKYLPLGDFFLLPLLYSFYPVPFFLLGMLLYVFRDHVFLDWRPVVVLLAIYLVSRNSWPNPIFFYLTFIYGLLWFGSANGLRKMTPKHDYSYGIYLYGFVVQQVVSSIHPSMNSYLSLMISVPITVALAALSWHAVERPCLASFRRRTPAPAADIRSVVINEPGS